MLRIKRDLAYRRIAEELFIVDAAKSELHELNGPAAVIWEGIASGKNGPGIISDIVSEFEVDEKTARADLAEFTEELLRQGLLTNANS
ncbi:MAG: hypothetical protein A2270_06315 [Elusimicrobia bacterium RIFOXYA12_FULL_51_18]|nr:MAG: hypothetical protein A2270_06315 [Elusimicrobia bacterium RIFOXYA12_FULL_51_18]OGS29815.1 MAG: hypothetical protein A2218_03385 [Elusimicrobia bacterium RIFOXYA2_FULL_53_38]